MSYKHKNGVKKRGKLKTIMVKKASYLSDFFTILCILNEYMKNFVKKLMKKC